jgi:Protein of unknown function (DUF3717)
MNLTMPDLEQAINYWRARHPSQGEERALSSEVNALASVYALMIYQRHNTIPLTQLSPLAQQLIQAWREQIT